MRKFFVVLVCLFVLATAIPCRADSPGSASPLVTRMQARLDQRQATVNGWASQARWQLGLSIIVGMLGRIIGIVQGANKTWTKSLTVGLGFCISAVTLCTNRIFPADYRTLMRSVQQGQTIIDDLKDMLSDFDST